MGCACQNKGADQRVYAGDGVSPATSFNLVFMDGTVQTFGSRLEADAANARSGYQGVVQPA